ncbi:putative glucan 1,3-beta-glucosidase D [Aspergillus novoparasiticus]|uniref:glucan 1,3-beta-glucosidase n=1 Tax=Aspergillus novoparasiticus TaxID=986946 RepID=A0A5N6EEH1_9EURO|nr:putative glucan 1,3-beta-glucosidase D [Aspergillus novoparasiticus]
MPSHSRSRDRYRGERDPSRRYREVYDDDDDDDDDDFDYHPRERRRYRRDDYQHDIRSHESPDYDDDLNEYDVATEDPAVPLRSHDVEGRRRERSRAGGSPIASPSRRDRNRGGEEYRRHGTYGDGGSPTRAVRDRRHRSRDGQGERPRDMDREARRQRRRERARGAAAMKHKSSDSTNSGSHLLSADALAKLRSYYDEKDHWERSQAEEQPRTESKRQRKRPIVGDEPQTLAPFPDETPRGQSKGRIVSGAYLEEGHPEMEVRHRGGGGPAMEARWRKEGNWDGTIESSDAQPPFWKRKKWWIVIGVLIVVLAIVIPVAVVMSKKHGHGDDKSGSSSSVDNSDSPYISSLNGLSHDSIPESAQGSILDPWTWYDTRDFNLTFTNETVGGLPIMGLNSTWDDSTRPNDNVPPLNESFPYGSQPIRGVNLGGWLSIEPFIVPSLFESYSSKDRIIDEYTLCKKLGSSAASTIEKHYADFISEQDFIDMRDAGLDHVRIQFSYWAVTTYDDDPYVAKISWRYLLRAIEYCRKYGLRVNLDPHGIPGSQNGWNHSGREGVIGWLNGTDGQLNRQRSLDFHNQISQFFAQPRYKNVVTIYGLVNEPLMLSLPVEDVLNWTTDATKLVQKNGISAYVTVHDGFLNLSKWKQMLKDRPDRMFLDTHQYTIFNTGQIVLNHTDRVKLICNDWYNMIKEINTTSAGWGPTICGEWSQADTDCAQYLNNVGRGTRWEGTFAIGDSTVYCPTADTGPTCSCASANAPPADYSDGYKKFLQTYAEAQMSAFGTAQGWFYWTWHTESAAQWSYKTAWKNGYMPKKAYAPNFKCGDDIPSFGDLPEFY